MQVKLALLESGLICSGGCWIGGEIQQREMDMLVKANVTTFFREEKNVAVHSGPKPLLRS